jgi:hypothetical protein
LKNLSTTVFEDFLVNGVGGKVPYTLDDDDDVDEDEDEVEDDECIEDVLKDADLETLVDITDSFRSGEFVESTNGGDCGCRKCVIDGEGDNVTFGSMDDVILVVVNTSS